MSDAKALGVKIDSLTKDDETPVLRSSELDKILRVSKSGIIHYLEYSIDDSFY